jgi:hypothetical protein
MDKRSEQQFITKQESDRFPNPSNTRAYEAGIGKGNVKVRPESTGLPHFDQKTFNRASAEIAEGVKSGATAKENAAKSERLEKGGKRAFPKDPTVKINSAK